MYNHKFQIKCQNYTLIISQLKVSTKFTQGVSMPKTERNFLNETYYIDWNKLSKNPQEKTENFICHSGGQAPY